MKRIVRFVVFTLILTVCLGMMTACNGKQKNDIENVIAEFEYACNTLDTEAVLNTINPKVSDKIKLALGVFGMLSDQDTSDVLESISDALIGDEQLNGNDFFSSIKIDVSKITVDGESAVADAEVQYTIAGEEYKRSAEFECVYYLDQWYISNLQFK